MQLEYNKRRREDEERRVKQERDEQKMEKIERELRGKKREKRRKYLENKLLDIIITSKNSKEEKKEECSKDKMEFNAGITEIEELVKDANLSESENTFRAEHELDSHQAKTFEKTFACKIIVGWKLKSNYENEKGG